MATRNIWIRQKTYEKEFNYLKVWFKLLDDGSYIKIKLIKYFNDKKMYLYTYTFFKINLDYTGQSHLLKFKIMYFKREYINNINSLIDKYNIDNKFINSINDLYND